MHFTQSIALLACGLGFATAAPVSTATSKPFHGQGFLRVNRNGRDVGCLDSKAQWNNGSQCHKYTFETIKGFDDFFYIRASPNSNDYVFEVIDSDNPQLNVRPESSSSAGLNSFMNENGLMMSMQTYLTTYYSTELLNGNTATTPISSEKPKGQSFELEISFATIMT